MDVRAHVERDGEFSVKRVELRYGRRHSQTPREVYWKSRDVTFSERADDLVALALMPAMQRGETLVVHGDVSEQLMANLPRLQELLVMFGPYHGHDLKAIDVQPTRLVPAPAAGTRSATFFSGGLDSFATALRHQDELGAMVFVHGFDIDVRNGELRDQVEQRIRHVAAEMTIPLIQIETDLRAFIDRSLNWTLYYGSALACLGLSMQNEFQRMYIASSLPVQLLHNVGSHPLLDYLWSTEALEFVHDLAELDRLQKAAYIAQFDVARRNLRVCYRNSGGEYNCGSCRKCELMQLVLASLGVLDQFPVFDVPLQYEKVRAMDVSDMMVRERAIACMNAIVERNGDRELYEAIRLALRGWVENLKHPPEPVPFEGDLLAKLFPPTSISVDRGS